MNITVKVRRGIRFLCAASVLVVLLVALSACSRTTSPAISPAGANDSYAQANESVTQPSVGEQAFANTEILSSIESDGMGIELSSAQGSSQMIVRTSSPSVDYTVTRLSSPSRLVLDILNGEQRKNEEFNVSSNEFVQRVRVGAHPDKSRIVIDLNEKDGFTYDAEAVGGSLIVRMSSEDGGPMAQPKFQINETEIAANKPEITAPQGPVLETFRIEEMGGSENSLIAEMTSAGFFTLEQTAPSEYVLRLEGATFDANELSTLLAPPKSGAIRSVRVTSEGNDTLLRIFADPTKKLAARTRGSNIIVEEQPLAPGADIRAQAEIEEPSTTDAADVDEALGEGADLSELESEVTTLLDEAPKYTGRQISLDLQDTDIDNALRIIAEVSNLNIIASDDVAGKVTLRLIDVPWDQALDVILKTNGLDKVLEGNVMRIAPIEKLRQEREALKQAQEAEEELEPLVVKYVRVSYAKASELRSLTETVLTERGTVAYDERTNQLIIKDIRRGVKNVAELISRLDLRTPQVLLETQIVEAQRSFLREFGSEIGFSYIASPATGNPTGNNFPNSINFGGSVDPGAPGIGSSFPAAVDISGGSAVSLLLDSADGTRSLDMRLSALEREGRVR
ncbi:MAG: AMIN domain-containing protein, partial [Bdellovibrionales bacterium]|nr:AMIN domain-containing protein [Bdellovibrionales bacterium]